MVIIPYYFSRLLFYICRCCSLLFLPIHAVDSLSYACIDNSSLPIGLITQKRERCFWFFLFGSWSQRYFHATKYPNLVIYPVSSEYAQLVFVLKTWFWTHFSAENKNSCNKYVKPNMFKWTISVNRNFHWNFTVIDCVKTSTRWLMIVVLFNAMQQPHTKMAYYFN